MFGCTEWVQSSQTDLSSLNVVKILKDLSKQLYVYLNYQFQIHKTNIFDIKSLWRIIALQNCVGFCYIST